jgi:glycosyltransferase involved in cell wall biosynthesis
VRGPARPNRILFHGLWFRSHNNPRYAELLPRLERLDRVLIMVSGRRPVRAAQFRALHAVRPLRNRLLLRLGSRHYRYLLTADYRQVPFFGGAVVADVDDPVFTPAEVAALSRPNLAAYVVTDERAARRFEQLGVGKPWHVVPQGVSLASLSGPQKEEVARLRGNGAFVVGYMAAYLRAAEDPGGDDALYNIDHLLDLWPTIAGRVPSARLWLLGEPSPRVRARVAGRDDIVLFGRVPKEDVLAHAANFDVALYPRTEDQGIRAA